MEKIKLSAKPRFRRGQNYISCENTMLISLQDSNTSFYLSLKPGCSFECKEYMIYVRNI